MRSLDVAYVNSTQERRLVSTNKVFLSAILVVNFTHFAVVLVPDFCEPVFRRYKHLQDKQISLPNSHSAKKNVTVIV